MLKKTLIKNTLMVTFVLGLTACANTDGLEASVTELSNKVDALSSDVTALKTQQQATNKEVKAARIAAEQAATDVKKANERVNNMVASYKK
ncbi:MAG: Lpp/OprI family alanine-zipper lipoprotein [Colwellia sp.]